MKHRLLRVNELLKRELSAIISREIAFGKALVSVSHVDTTPDLKNAHVYVSVLAAAAGPAALIKLEENRILLQNELAKHVVLKYTPHLAFHLDDSIERGSRVIEILQQIDVADDAAE